MLNVCDLFKTNTITFFLYINQGYFIIIIFVVQYFNFFAFEIMFISIIIIFLLMFTYNFLIFLVKNDLAKVSDWNSFQVNQNYSDSFRYLNPSQCESFRTNPKNVLYHVWWKTVKNKSDLIRLISRDQSEWIRTNPKPSFQSRFSNEI